MSKLPKLSRPEIEKIMSKLKRPPMDEFRYDDEDVLFRCGLRASRRISHAGSNPGKKFFGCPGYVSQAEKGCGYFVWYAVKVAAMKEKQELVEMVEKLQVRVKQLEEANVQLQAQNGEVSCSSEDEVCCSNNSNGKECGMAGELEMLKYRVGLLEKNGCRRHGSGR